MYAYLRGRVVEKRPTELVLEVGGVGYRLRVPLSSSERLPASGEALVHTALVVREDGQALYGFHSPEARALFERLLRISGVGPQTALAILSAGEPGEVLDAVRRSDAAFLTRVRGVGPKTAQRAILELADEAAESPLAAKPGPARDAVQALLTLGYDRADAESRVAAALSRIGAKAPTEALIREAARGRMRS